MLAAARGGDDDADADADAAANGGDGDSPLSGSVAVDDSSTVFPVTEAVAEEFGKIHRDRPRHRRHRVARARIGLDGLAVVTNPDNDFLDGITLDELKQIWDPEAEGEVTRWNQIRTDRPDERIELFGPGVDSGTFDFFTETVVGEGGASYGDFTASEDDNFLVGVAGEEASLGYFGYAYFAENPTSSGSCPSTASSPATKPSPTAATRSRDRSSSTSASTRSARRTRSASSCASTSATPASRCSREVGYTAIAAAELASSRAALEAAIVGAATLRAGS